MVKLHRKVQCIMLWAVDWANIPAGTYLYCGFCVCFGGNMADDDDGFKICGLCAQLPEESVAVTHDLAVFIADFLAGSLSRVPSKVCTECVQSAEDAKIFRNKCIKGK